MDFFTLNTTDALVNLACGLMCLSLWRNRRREGCLIFWGAGLITYAAVAVFYPFQPGNAVVTATSIVLDPWEASIRVRHLGPYPLIEDNSVRDSGSTVVNLRAARKIGRFQVYGELLNILNSRDKDIAYYYESYIPAFDTAGPIDGRLSRVVEPRTFRLGARVNF